MATVYHDMFQSITRRRLQAEKDEKALAEPVRSALSGGAPGVFLNLRPIDERIAAATPRQKTPAERLLRRARKECKKGRINKAQLRKHAAFLKRTATFAEPAEPTS